MNSENPTQDSPLLLSPGDPALSDARAFTVNGHSFSFAKTSSPTCSGENAPKSLCLKEGVVLREVDENGVLLEYPLYHRKADGRGLFICFPDSNANVSKHRGGGDRRWAYQGSVYTDASKIKDMLGQGLRDLYCRHYAELENLPLNGEPVLNPDLTAGGFFVESVKASGAWVTYADMVIRQRVPGKPIYEARRCGVFTYDVLHDSTERKGHVLHALSWTCAAWRDWHRASAYFTEPALHLFKTMALRGILPSSSGSAPIPEIFYAEDALPMLYSMLRQQMSVQPVFSTWHAEVWEKMSMEEISADLLARVLAA